MGMSLPVDTPLQMSAVLWVVEAPEDCRLSLRIASVVKEESSVACICVSVPYCVCGSLVTFE